MLLRPPAKLVQLAYIGSGVQRAQSDSPGATTSTVRPKFVKPEDDSAEMLLLTHLPLPKKLAPACQVCAKSWLSVDAAAEMTSGSWESLPIVPVMPPSPVDSVIVTPA